MERDGFTVHSRFCTSSSSPLRVRVIEFPSKFCSVSHWNKTPMKWSRPTVPLKRLQTLRIMSEKPQSWPGGSKISYLFKSEVSYNLHQCKLFTLQDEFRLVDSAAESSFVSGVPAVSTRSFLSGNERRGGRKKRSEKQLGNWFMGRSL